jgi:hypothetical protein
MDRQRRIPVSPASNVSGFGARSRQLELRGLDDPLGAPLRSAFVQEARVIRARCRAAFGALALLALVAHLALPLAHRITNLEPAQAAHGHHGVAFENAAPAGHSPLECILCDALVHGRQPFRAPSAILALASPAAPPLAFAPQPVAAPRAGERGLRPARAPPVRSVSA